MPVARGHVTLLRNEARAGLIPALLYQQIVQIQGLVTEAAKISLWFKSDGKSPPFKLRDQVVSQKWYVYVPALELLR